MGRGHVKVDDRVWKELRRRVERIGEHHVRVGVLASKGGDQAHEEGSPITLIELAAIHELGSPAAGIPARSSIRKTFDLRKDALARAVAKLARAVVDGRMEYEQALNVLGSWGVQQVKARITSGAGVPPPLQPATIARKGSSRPLVDTGRLLNAITWEVVEGEGT